IELILTVFENIHMAEEEINEFFADIVCVGKDEFKNMPLSETMGIFKETFSSGELSDFFKQAGQLIQ
ncbi:MAG: hypothetical protein SCK28_04515, partial [Bacillota bacterium]|nr:hypothetical protein [Bacillota bacterium]